MVGPLNPAASGRWQLIGATLAVALLLTALPVPQWAEPWRPPWVLLVLVYWYLALPTTVGLAAAWLCGLLVDVLHGAVLGQHAVAFTLIAYLAVLLHLRIRPFPLGQQALLVAALVLLASVTGQLVQWITGTPGRALQVFAPALTSALLWPWLFVVLRDLRRRWRLT